MEIAVFPPGFELQPRKGSRTMNRILLIDRDRTLGASLGMACLERGIAIRMAETFCEGVRYLMDFPITAVLVDGALLHAAGVDRGPPLRGVGARRARGG